MVSNREPQDGIEKRPYATPKLEVYGPIAKLTRNTGRGARDNAGGGKT